MYSKLRSLAAKIILPIMLILILVIVATAYFARSAVNIFLSAHLSACGLPCQVRQS